MTDEEIDQLSGTDLEVAYAEQVLGYEYRPGKDERKPWYCRGYPYLESLPYFLGWNRALDGIRGLTQESYPFLDRYAKEYFDVEVTFCRDRASVTVFLYRNGRSLADNVWDAEGMHVGEAFLRAVLKAAGWFRKERDWKPK